jgi:hypothetical protein
MIQLEEGAINELYEFKLRANQDMSLFGVNYVTNEAVLIFEQPKMSILKGFKNNTIARGGRVNKALVVWEESSPPAFMISKGYINPLSLGLIMNAQKIASAQTVIINKTDKLYLSRTNTVTLTETPIANTSTFVYSGNTIPQMNKCTFQFLPDANVPSKNLEIVGASNTSIIVDYKYNTNSRITYTVAKRNMIGSFSAEIKYYFKNYTTEENQTVYLVMPRVYCTSDFNLMGSAKGDVTIGDLTFAVECDANGKYYDLSIFETDLDATI